MQHSHPLNCNPVVRYLQQQRRAAQERRSQGRLWGRGGDRTAPPKGHPGEGVHLRPDHEGHPEVRQRRESRPQEGAHSFPIWNREIFSGNPAPLGGPQGEVPRPGLPDDCEAKSG